MIVQYYKVTNVATGEQFIAKSKEVHERIGLAISSVSKYADGETEYKKKWKIEKAEEISEKRKIDYFKYNKMKLKQFREPENISKCLALYDAYTSGRSDLWTLTEIASEFSVPIKDVKKVLKEEGKL